MDITYSSVSSSTQTKSIQQAIDNISLQGGSLRFLPGTYKTGTLHMRSHVTIVLEKGAVIQGSEYIEDYPVDTGRKEEGTNGEYMSFSRLIFFDGVENAGIRGEGTIHGNGKLIRQKGRAANLIRVQNSRNIHIENVQLRDSAGWNTHILYSKDIFIRDVTIINDLSNRNTDGVDIDSSCNVYVDGCYMYCGDDCVVVKTTRNSDLLRAVEHVRVTNNVFFTLKAAQKIGTESFADIRDVRFGNNTVLFADRAIGVYNCDGGNFEDIHFVNTSIVKAREEVEIQSKERFGKGKIKQILII